MAVIASELRRKRREPDLIVCFEFPRDDPVDGFDDVVDRQGRDSGKRL